MVEKNQLYNISTPSLIPIKASKSDFDNLLNSFRLNETKKIITLIFRGNKMKDVSSLFNEMSAAMQFPYYFGENWDAFDECINDLSWLPGQYYILGINDIQEILINEDNSQLDIFFELLKDTCHNWSKPVDLNKKWGRPAKPFHFLLQYNLSDEELVQKRFSKHIHF